MQPRVAPIPKAFYLSFPRAEINMYWHVWLIKKKKKDSVCLCVICINTHLYTDTYTHIYIPEHINTTYSVCITVTRVHVLRADHLVLESQLVSSSLRREFLQTSAFLGSCGSLCRAEALWFLPPFPPHPRPL